MRAPNSTWQENQENPKTTWEDLTWILEKTSSPNSPRSLVQLGSTII